jgi:uncharacterized protein YbdZ (MbtH family)
MRGDGIETAVAPLVVAAMEPAPLTIALEAVAPRDAHARTVDHQGRLRIERARSEAERAQRRSEDVQPAHRVVARSLERDWHETLTVLAQLERDDTALAPAAARSVSEAERHSLVDVGHDLPAGWPAETTTHAARTQVVRVLMQDGTLTK